VAKLATLRLLRELPEWPAPRLKCVCFATPAVGNSALADLVKNAGWGIYFRTYFLPGKNSKHFIQRGFPILCNFKHTLQEDNQAQT
jgi:hypothetical protein